MQNSTRRRRRWLWTGLVALGVAVAAVVGAQLYHHATPARALASAGGPYRPRWVESISFAHGQLLVARGTHQGFLGWYVTPSVWGWHLAVISQVSGGLTPANQRTDWAAIQAQGTMLVWGGGAEQPLDAVRFTRHGRTFTAAADHAGLWHLTLPFTLRGFPNADWTVELSIGNTVPMYPPA